jgi:TonB family protein
LPSSVALVELAGSARHETTVSEDGSFTFPAIPTGIYLARLNSVERFTRPVPVSVLTSDISGVVIGVTPAKEIKVRLSMNRGSRRPDALSLRSGAWPGMIGVPQPDGTFSFSVPEGSNRIEIYAVDYEVLEMKYGSIDLLKEPLNVSAADTVEVLATLGRIPSTDAYLWGLERPATNVYVAIQGGAASATCLECPSPEYPALARTARISDTIALAVVVGNDGQVSNPRVISGHQLLQQAAVDAVKKWRFVPLAAGVSLRVFLVFRFDQQA